MIIAWVLYYDGDANRYTLAELNGADYKSLDPESWGLKAGIEIVATFQAAQFMQAWVEGRETRKW